MQLLSVREFLVPCLFKKYLGYECPGCGMQRALVSLFEGDVIQSFNYNPAGIPFFITVFVTLLQIKFKWNKGGLVVMWLFILTTAVMMTNYTIKIINGSVITQ